jgi:hypothetical protein
MVLVISLYYGGNMTMRQVIRIFRGYWHFHVSRVSNLLIKNQADFKAEKTAVYLSGLESSPWQHFDQTAARVGGVNHTTNVICNPLYIAFLRKMRYDWE